MILKAYKDLAVKKTNKEIIANKRLSICKKCEFYYKGICDRRRCHGVDDKRVCGCGCILKAKVYVEDKNSCPLNKWVE